jgi:hypothetical protein
MAEINAAEAESHRNYGRPDIPAGELVLQLEGDWGPANDIQGYGWALLLELSACQRFDDGLTTGADSGPEWIAAPFLYRTFIDSSPVSRARALIHVDVYRTHHTGMVHRVVEEIFDRAGRRMRPKREQRALAGGRRAGHTTAPRNSGEAHRPTAR